MARTTCRHASIDSAFRTASAEASARQAPSGSAAAALHQQVVAAASYSVTRRIRCPRGREGWRERRIRQALGCRARPLHGGAGTHGPKRCGPAAAAQPGKSGLNPLAFEVTSGEVFLSGRHFTTQIPRAPCTAPVQRLLMPPCNQISCLAIGRLHGAAGAAANAASWLKASQFAM